MAEFAMWGPEQSGPRLALQDQQKAQMNTLMMQDVSAQVRERNATASAMEQKAQQDQQQQQIMMSQAAQQKAQVPQQQQQQFLGMADGLNAQGQALIDAGYPERGGKLVNEASQIMSHLASATHSQAQTEQTRYKAGLEKADQISRLVDGVENAEDWKGFQNEVAQMFPDKAEDIKKIPYSQKAKEKIQNLALSFKDKIELTRKEANQKSLDESRAAADRIRDMQIPLINARIDLMKAREEHIEKNSGAKPATKEMRTLADKVLASKYIDMDTEERYLQAQKVSEDATELRKSNPSMPASEAVEKALAARSTKGEYKNYMKAKEKTPPKSSVPSNFKTEADVQKAVASGLVKKGDKIVINGVSGTWQ